MDVRLILAIIAIAATTINMIHMGWQIYKLEERVGKAEREIAKLETNLTDQPEEYARALKEMLRTM